MSRSLSAHDWPSPPAPANTLDAAHGQARAADVLALGFGTTVAMWTLGFIGRLPGAPLPSFAVFFLLLAALGGGGFLVGRYTRRGVRGGVYVGLLAGCLNLLILGSLLSGSDGLNRAALLWIPGSLLISAGLTAAGAAVGSRFESSAQPNWPASFAFVTVFATLVLIAVGGTVTGFDYGLAVVDWPNTEGYNMFLYPLARMTGGIYYEHAHRLIGSLVGLTTLVLAIYLQMADRRRHVRVLAWSAFALVVAQGILGGLRVTGYFTLSTDAAETAPNIALAIVHGVTGQIFLGLLVCLAVVLTLTWRERRAAMPAPSAGTDRFLAVSLIGLLLVQLVFGALVRHLTWAVHHLPHGLAADATALVDRGQWALNLHIVMAVLVTLAAVAVGVRAWGIYDRIPALRRAGIALLVLIAVQLALGITAAIVVGNDSVRNLPTAVDVALTTSHQTVGALLLALAVGAALLSYRLLQPDEDASRGAAAGT